MQLRTRTLITGLIMGMVGAVLFGVGAIAVLSVPSLNAQAAYLIPVVIAISVVLSPVIAWFIAPRMRSKAFHERRMHEQAS